MRLIKKLEKNNFLTPDEWLKLSYSCILSEEFIEKYKDKVYWYSISISQKLSESFIEKYKDKLTWTFISIYQELSEPFIEKHKDKVDWTHISRKQKLSEFFIEKYKDKVFWPNITVYQKLSLDFLIKYKDKIDWYNIKNNKNIPEEYNTLEKINKIIKEKELNDIPLDKIISDLQNYWKEQFILLSEKELREEWKEIQDL